MDSQTILDNVFEFISNLFDLIYNFIRSFFVSNDEESTSASN